MTDTPRMLLVLSENWTLTGGRADLPAAVRWAREAEDAGFDSVMVSEHIVLGPDAASNGVMGNPRDYALPGNQDPYTPWPNSLLLLSAIASVTERLRLAAAAVLAPLRHPLLMARELGTLDLISEGRLLVQPTVSWSKDEYDALGVPFDRRGQLLDEHLAVWAKAWGPSPISHESEHYRFRDVYFEPKAYRPEGPRLWFGGQRLGGPVLRRLVRYGYGFHPLGRPTPQDIQVLKDALAAVGRDIAELEMIGGTQAVFPDDHSPADLGAALAAIPEQMEQGFTTFCIKPNQFIDDPDGIGVFCRDVMRRVEALRA
ncbi:LLM class flavin-dependent oxidoreductase [Streptomyces sp. NPDC050549]|uniref:LLM class flavin-dependent oxidoreductase n=1 Tax=Streptomyces sp. NPDC050549 TaxID=3155406 RepID=UPI003441F61B